MEMDRGNGSWENESRKWTGEMHRIDYGKMDWGSGSAQWIGGRIGCGGRVGLACNGGNGSGNWIGGNGTGKWIGELDPWKWIGVNRSEGNGSRKLDMRNWIDWMTRGKRIGRNGSPAMDCGREIDRGKWIGAWDRMHGGVA